MRKASLGLVRFPNWHKCPEASGLENLRPYLNQKFDKSVGHTFSFGVSDGLLNCKSVRRRLDRKPFSEKFDQQISDFDFQSALG